MEADQTPAATSRNRIASVPRGVYLAALAAAVVWLAATRGDEVAELLDQARLPLIAVALAATFGLILLTARFWVLSLRMLGHRTTLGEVALATARALPARYVPVGVSFPAARVALLRSRDLDVAPLMVTAGLEMVIRPAVALALGTALLAVSGSLPVAMAWAAAVLAVAVVAASPAVGGRILSRLAERRGTSLNITWSGYARLAAADTAYWIAGAATFVIYLRAFPAADSFGTLQVAGAFMVAWAVGFITVFAPQGLGVTEVSLVALLTANNDDTGIALTVLFGGYRLVQIARDTLAAATAELITKRQTQQARPPQ